MSHHRVALVTGAGGQDGVYLVRLLRDHGHAVVAVVRPAGLTPSVAAYLPSGPGLTVVEADVTHADSLRHVVAATKPDEIYNLAAISSVAQSWKEPELTRAVNVGTVATILDAVRDLERAGHPVRFLQASSGEVSGSANDSPYAQAKSDALELVQQARDRDGLYAVAAELHNHESPLRPARFVTRKITRAAAEIALGRRECVTLGNLDVRRDWGFAGDYVVAMRQMLRMEKPCDLPIGTGTTHSLADLVERAMGTAGVEDAWSHVQHDPDLVRPVDAAVLVADPEPAVQQLGWRSSTTFGDLVDHMVRVDLERIEREVEDDPIYLYPRTPRVPAGRTD